MLIRRRRYVSGQLIGKDYVEEYDFYQTVSKFMRYAVKHHVEIKTYYHDHPSDKDTFIKGDLQRLVFRIKGKTADYVEEYIIEHGGKTANA